MENNEQTIQPLRLGNLARLAQRLGTSVERLQELAGNAQLFYDPFDLSAKRQWFSKKEPKKPRPIDRPTGPLLALQSNIYQELLHPILMPEHIFGAVPQRTIFGNAECHRKASLLITLDVKQCFPSITPKHVYRVWSVVLGCSPMIAKLLTKLTTYRRRLPQGSPTSPALANLLIWSIDAGIRSECARLGVMYSTWLDDLAFSGSNARQLIQITVGQFRQEGLKFSHRKITIMGPRDTKTLTGTRAGLHAVRVPRTYIGQVRAGIHNLAEGRVAPQDYAKYVEQLIGRLRYIHKVCPADSRSLKAQLQTVMSALPVHHRAVFELFSKSCRPFN
ncbi:reverse transcriptase family protein [Edaphobacter sp.]|uniref:reverse transcriptase family protein n=1 Tax=Edaphobacter sp. TaxID=1934404 RepID=UPI002DBF80D5|nr:reverse transcriptase family protein [Edaphobacter sp.]HEU5340423.1 reverse transcriptase family protein [Edaphobacter sp.]